MDEFDDDDLGDLFDDTVPIAAGRNISPAERPEPDISKALVSFTQRTQAGFAALVDQGETAEPSNELEKILCQLNVSIMRDENYQRTLHIKKGNHVTFSFSLRKLVEKKQKSDDVLSAIEEAVRDMSNLRLYLSPMSSDSGVQEAAFRSFLHCPTMQVRCIDILVDKINALSKEEPSKEVIETSLACVEQLRFLELVVDAESLVNIVFEKELHNWHPAARDALIEALPEILQDPVSQQTAAINLQDLLEQKPKSDGAALRSAILRALNRLRMDGTTARSIRSTLCDCAMQFDARSAGELVAFCVDSLRIDAKSTLTQVLTELSTSLHLEKIRSSQTQGLVTADEMIVEVSSCIYRYVQLDGTKGWKGLREFLKGGVVAQMMEDGGEPHTARSRSFSVWDVMLICGGLSLENCPTWMISDLRRTLSDQSSLIPELMDAFCTLIKFKKYSIRHGQALLSIARQCVWSEDGVVRQFGAFVYKTTFLKLEKLRQEVLTAMLWHMSKDSVEAAVVLNAVEELAKSDRNSLRPFLLQLHKCIELMDSLSVDNIKKLFSILIGICSTADPEDIAIKLKDVEESISMFASSVNAREQLWGALGILMQIQHHLIHRSDQREKSIKEKLQLLETVIQRWNWLRRVCYGQLASILKDNIRVSKSIELINWTESLFKKFNDEFFVKRPSDYTSESPLEGDLFTMKGCQIWLAPPRDRLEEGEKLFLLLKEAEMLKQRWLADNDTETGLHVHFQRFFFAFQANIGLEDVLSSSITCVDEAKKEADVLYYTAQWCRMLMNTFCDCEPAWVGTDKETWNLLWTTKFTLMFECQKQWLRKINACNEWKVIDGSRFDTETWVVAQMENVSKRASSAVTRKGTKRRKKGNAEAAEVPDDEEVRDENEQEVPEPQDNEREEDLGNKKKDQVEDERTKIPIEKALEILNELRLAVIVKLLPLVMDKRSATTFLLESLLTVITRIFPKRESKSPWAKTKLSSSEIEVHGDATHRWKLLIKSLPVVISILDKSIEYFEDDLNSSSIVDRDVTLVGRIGNLSRVCLLIVSSILTSKEVVGNSESRGYSEKREIVLTKIERCLLSIRKSQEETDDGASQSFLNYLIRHAHAAPSADVAAALLDAAAAVMQDEDDLKEQLGQRVIGYLKREWTDAEGAPLKGPALSKAASIFLNNYLRCRLDDNRLSAIQWFLAHKLADVVPDDEKRRSKMTSYESCEDPWLTAADARQRFTCISRVTFAGLYKVLFTHLNSCISKRLMGSNRLRTGQISTAACIADWRSAASSFCLLGVMLRVRELRNASVLTTAAREGKTFLANLSKNSSFMYLMEDSNRFAPISGEATVIIKAVQIGNRNLQGVSVYAKTVKSAILLKLLPELRAASEQWIRGINSALVSVGCHEAFEIGLLKSRDIDGEEIRAPSGTDSGESSDSDVSERQETQNQNSNSENNEDQSRRSEVY